MAFPLPVRKPNRPARVGVSKIASGPRRPIWASASPRAIPDSAMSCPITRKTEMVITAFPPPRQAPIAASRNETEFPEMVAKATPTPASHDAGCKSGFKAKGRIPSLASNRSEVGWPCGSPARGSRSQNCLSNVLCALSHDLAECRRLQSLSLCRRMSHDHLGTRKIRLKTGLLACPMPGMRLSNRADRAQKDQHLAAIRTMVRG